MEFLSWLERTPMAEWVQASDWGSPMMLCAHSIGMALVVGLVFVLGIRVLGFPRGLSIAGLRQLVPLAWAGFILNALSGVMLFMANATGLIVNWTFQLKMVLIVAGGLSLWWLWRLLPQAVGAGEAESPAPTHAKVVAALTILFWLGAITSGRYIAYTLQSALLGL